jgi:hypothetical protein
MKIGNLEVYGVIYKITNIINGKVYIGQTINGFDRRYDNGGIGIERVYNFHKCAKKNKGHFNQHLLGSIEKYGFNAFEVTELLDIAFSKEELNIKEICWIKTYKSNKSSYGYNQTDGGDNSFQVTRKIICLNNREIFNSITNAIKEYNTKSMLSHLSNPKKYKSAGKDKISNEKLVWSYYEDYLNMSEKDIEERILFTNTSRKFYKKGSRKSHKIRKIICVTTNEEFESVYLAQVKYKIGSYIFEALKDINKSCGKHPITNEPLKWEYVI